MGLTDANLSKLISLVLLPHFNTLHSKPLQPNPIPTGQVFPWGRCHLDKIKETKKRAAESTCPPPPQQPDALRVSLKEVRTGNPHTNSGPFVNHPCSQ